MKQLNILVLVLLVGVFACQKKEVAPAVVVEPPPVVVEPSKPLRPVDRIGSNAFEGKIFGKDSACEAGKEGWVASSRKYKSYGVDNAFEPIVFGYGALLTADSAERRINISLPSIPITEKNSIETLKKYYAKGKTAWMYGNGIEGEGMGKNGIGFSILRTVKGNFTFREMPVDRMILVYFSNIVRQPPTSYVEILESLQTSSNKLWLKIKFRAAVQEHFNYSTVPDGEIEGVISFEITVQ